MNKRKIIKKYFKGLIIAFMICISLSFSVSSISNKEIVKTSFNGNILYVGGSGPGNYTKIQDAINDASSGNIVFVFTESSPYYENVQVDKSIKLVGENKDIVIIDGRGTGRVVSIESNDVTVTGFTIKNSGNTWYHDSGIGFGTFGSPNYDHVTIKDNKIITNYDGIYAYYGESHVFSNNILEDNRNAGIYMHSGCKKSTISGNTMNNNEIGLYCQNVDENEIFDNTITNNDYGIYVLDSQDDSIHNNVLSDNNYGLVIEYFWNGEIYRNQIQKSEEGLYCGYAPFSTIKENNFEGNSLHSRFCYPLMAMGGV